MKSLKRFLIPWGIILFPLLQFQPLHGLFGGDWSNHVWLISYFGEYFRQHLSFPKTVVTEQAIGSAFPVFYGYLFYPLLGIVASVFSAQFVLKAAIILLNAAEFYSIRGFLIHRHLPNWFANAIGAIVVWAIYPMTNLYSRGAVAEYFATGFALCATCEFFRMVSEEESKFSLHFVNWIIASTLTLGTHPITAIYFVFIFVLAFILVPAAKLKSKFLLFRPRIELWFWPLAGLLSVSPWFYANKIFLRKLHINKLANPTGASNVFDSWYGRFFPTPFDERLNYADLSTVSSPHLDVQVNMPLLALTSLLCVWVYRESRFQFSSEKKLPVGRLILCFVCFAFFSWMTVSPHAMEVLPRWMSIIDFVYRFITYQNLLILLALFVLVEFCSEIISSRIQSTSLVLVTGLALGVSSAGVVSKLSTVPSIKKKDGLYGRVFADERFRKRALELPSSLESHIDYTSASFYDRYVEGIHLPYQSLLWPVSSDKGGFGEMTQISLEASRPTWVATRVLSLPWNKILVNGVEVSKANLRTYGPHDGHLAFFVLPGKYVVGFQYQPDPIWLLLNNVAKWALWFLVLIGIARYFLLWFPKSSLSWRCGFLNETHSH